MQTLSNTLHINILHIHYSLLHEISFLFKVCSVTSTVKRQENVLFYWHLKLKTKYAGPLSYTSHFGKLRHKRLIKQTLSRFFFQQHVTSVHIWHENEKKILDIAYLFISQTLIRAVPDCLWNNFSSLKYIEGSVEMNFNKNLNTVSYSESQGLIQAWFYIYKQILKHFKGSSMLLQNIERLWFTESVPIVYVGNT